MLANWIHIIIVHFAVIATPWLLYCSFVNRKIELNHSKWKATYTGLIVIAVIAAIAYFTGPKAADWTKSILLPYPQDHVENHALWARVAFVVQVITGLLGIMGWASILQEELPDRRIPSILIFLLSINTVVMIYTAHLGGLIRRMDLIEYF